MTGDKRRRIKKQHGKLSRSQKSRESVIQVYIRERVTNEGVIAESKIAAAVKC